MSSQPNGVTVRSETCRRVLVSVAAAVAGRYVRERVVRAPDVRPDRGAVRGARPHAQGAAHDGRDLQGHPRGRGQRRSGRVIARPYRGSCGPHAGRITSLLPAGDELFPAFFLAMANWLRTHIGDILGRGPLGPRQLSAASAGTSNTWKASTRSSGSRRSPTRCARSSTRRTRNEWQRWLISQYATLIAQLQPAVGARERERNSYAILTLILGGWVTHGRGSALAGTVHVIGQRQLLIDTAMEVALQ